MSCDKLVGSSWHYFLVDLHTQLSLEENGNGHLSLVKYNRLMTIKHSFRMKFLYALIQLDYFKGTCVNLEFLSARKKCIIRIFTTLCKVLLP